MRTALAPQRSIPSPARSQATRQSAIYVSFAFSFSRRRGRPLARPPAPATSEGEHVEHRARLHPLQLGCGIDEPLVPCTAEADQDRDILLAIDREGHRRRVDATAGVELPEFCQRLGVV